MVVFVKLIHNRFAFACKILYICIGKVALLLSLFHVIEIKMARTASQSGSYCIAKWAILACNMSHITHQKHGDKPTISLILQSEMARMPLLYGKDKVFNTQKL